MTEKKDQYLGQLKKEYDELNFRWSRERDKFEADLQHESADVRKEYEAKREEYRKYRSDLQEKIVDLEVAGEDAWEDLKAGVELAWDSLGEAVKSAKSRFK